ncbi:GAF domain-containing protein [Paenarthrobacter sp. PH39-S1]|uniref:GAF domain-containing sensor histidine kinase n=1 Tax=Paenarthrobacter sp. PH39-S1 TaxID=3046204 RepID=UPI0024B9CE39|nr:GAF domain-containing protein [Paenarthrobacter sp. PH39-S1]MDJ0355456.1 GAF domain-containing protein [Paenarthrobacter sp. PH39-S1]
MNDSPRTGKLLYTQERMQGLMAAVVSIGVELDLASVLKQIVESACTLLHAGYGALGVIGDEGGLSHFITVGVDAKLAAKIGPLPTGHGVLGLLIREPQPIRLPDLRDHPASYGFPAHHPPMRTFLGVPVRVRDTVFGNLYLTEKENGELFSKEDEDLAVALATAAGVAIENAKLFDDSLLRSRWLEACMEVAAGAMGSGRRGGEAGPDLVAGRALEVSDAAMVLIAVPSDDGGPSYIAAAAGAGAGTFRGRPLDLDAAVVRRVLKTSGPAALTATELMGAGPGKAYGPALAVALGSADMAHGVLIFLRSAGAGNFSAAFLDMAGLYAAQAALALELVRTNRLREQLVVLTDRDRIAKDLHDVVIQRLFAAGLSIQSLGRLTDNPTAMQRIHAVTGELDATIRDLRDTIYSLQESAGNVELLSSRILRSVRNATRELPFAPRLHLAGPVDTALDDATSAHLLAVLSEGVSNAVRHSGAETIEVTVAIADGRVTLRVDDDGTGFGVPAHRSGLANMDHRARELNGSMSVDSAPGNGTRLCWSVPLPEAEG